MPLQLSPSDHKLLFIATGAFTVLVALALLLAKSGDPTTDIPTTYSTGSKGAKAAYLLLKSSGYKVERWQESPSALPDADGLTFILTEPAGAPTSEERDKLRVFVQSGGHLIVTGSFADLFLPEHGARPEPFPNATWKKAFAKFPSAVTRAAPEITLAPEAYWSPESFAVPLYGEGDKLVVVKFPFGKGDVTWWASATPLTNAGLKEPGNLEFFLASLGRPDQTRILWDEYFHGYRNSPASSTKSSPVIWFFAQLALFALALLLTYSRRSGPVSLPARESRLSPLEFVRTLGSLYQQADAGSVAVDIAYQRFRYWLTRRLGMSGNASVAELERSVGERWNFRDPNFNSTLSACESAHYDYTLKSRAALLLVRSLDDFAVQLKLFPTSLKEKD